VLFRSIRQRRAKGRPKNRRERLLTVGDCVFLATLVVAVIAGVLVVLYIAITAIGATDNSQPREYRHELSPIPTPTAIPTPSDIAKCPTTHPTYMPMNIAALWMADWQALGGQDDSGQTVLQPVAEDFAKAAHADNLTAAWNEIRQSDLGPASRAKLRAWVSHSRPGIVVYTTGATCATEHVVLVKKFSSTDLADNRTSVIYFFLPHGATSSTLGNLPPASEEGYRGPPVCHPGQRVVVTAESFPGLAAVLPHQRAEVWATHM